ncbi:S1C family serine protease [Paracidovorax valerianellae]|uniref:Trypsin-like peptidase domain-containing protein n=1 Tax=Paracidovorax valerianellae TaxID=187868 RepID=A0A1G6T2C7_9BURK|nr:trypsin-like peptidase domain-containing protein [Paracidovorax valerianellae]MDA8445465.1 trypsin-like peptidase domain-containing protein [Paracidovorax valerianellae]SDD22637.1 Trypsin-like peptidase domain-containing protein [Paracidovorax valerianellae]
MPRPPRYSSSRSDRRSAPEAPADEAATARGRGMGDAPSGPSGEHSANPHPAPNGPQAPNSQRTTQRALWAAIALLSVLLAASVWMGQRPAAPSITQKDIDAAVLRTLETQPLPAATARAVETIAPSVVRVIGYSHTKKGKEVERGIGTGVVILDKGVILTNLHVVQGATRVQVVFSDGMEASASVTGVQPENDLAVLQAHKIPDDLVAAPLRSTQNLRPGDPVVAVGFPFGIGPSASAGVVSGLEREFDSPEGKRELQHLIQFDAAANPGNSGGPLVTLDGEVVGIVTAILNPTPARTFIGIGFAVPIENAAAAVGMPPF